MTLTAGLLFPRWPDFLLSDHFRQCVRVLYWSTHNRKSKPRTRTYSAYLTALHRVKLGAVSSPHLVDAPPSTTTIISSQPSQLHFPLVRDAAHDKENARHLHDGCWFINISSFWEKSTCESEA